MNSVWRACADTKDAVPLYPSHGLYLKPVALLHVSVRLPVLKVPGKAVSHYEVMEKLRMWVQPEEFVALKVSKSTLEFVRFDAEIESKSKMAYVLGRMDGRAIKLAGIKEQLKVRAVEAKGDFPSKHDWDSFFRDSKDMNEMKPGERPDTVYLGNLPCKWFSAETDKPSEKLLRRIFEQFGPIRRIDVPMLDPLRNQMNVSISGIKQFTFNQNVIFEMYVQFEEYFCFVKCMDAFRGMKLVYIDRGREGFAASIKVDFDKSKHLSDGSVHRRSIVRERLEKKESERLAKELKQKEDEEKVENEKKLQKLERRKMREQKRKEKQLEKLKLKEVEDMNKKIAVEEYLLLMAQRKLESIRLLGELINRIKIEKEKESSSSSKYEKRKRRSPDKYGSLDDLNKKSKENSAGPETDAEKDLRYKLIQKFKRMQQEELIKEKVRLKALATDGSTTASRKATDAIDLSSGFNSDTEGDVSGRLRNDDDFPQRRNFNRYPNQRNWQNNRGPNDRQYFGQQNDNFDDYQNNRGRYNRNRRGYGRQQMYQNSWRGQYPNQCVMPIMDPMLLTYSHEYYKYLKKMARDSKRSRSRSRSWSRSSRSYSRSRSRSKSRNRTRSRFRSRSRSRSHDRGRSSRSRSRSHSRSRTRSRKRSYTRSYSRSRTRSRSRDKSRNKDKSRSRDRSKCSSGRSRSKSKTREEQPKNVEVPKLDDKSAKSEDRKNSEQTLSDGDKKRKKGKKQKKKKKEKHKNDDESKNDSK